jgi:hypothetical protein
MSNTSVNHTMNEKHLPLNHQCQRNKEEAQEEFGGYSYSENVIVLDTQYHRDRNAGH